MRLPTLLILILQVAVADSFREVFGYLGESVTLLSGADPLWNISAIEWSILSNNTWIATYRNGKKNVDRFWRYKGRLSLNTSSGDLMISNLAKEDAMLYTVELKNTEKKDNRSKIMLTVRKHLQKPNIHTLFSVLKEGSCLMVLQCSSPDKGVDFSWKIHPSNSTIFQFSNPKNQTSTLCTSFSHHSEVNFTCTASKNVQNTSSVQTARCYDDTPVKTDRFGLGVILGFFLGIVLGTILYFSRGRIKAALKNLKEKLTVLCTSCMLVGRF
ncbi:SLAM family member 9 isoform X1 [Centroberyx affinis]|uniref:SLAM family member 9 isoform X1 n=1 Tax=Centroberyx affinis TaxID=166261 RepID=UPI003A5C3C00